MEKEILDPCCGSKMFYFDKNDPRVLFCDCREVDETLCDGRSLVISPDRIEDFRQLSFQNNTFTLVIFDPPHLNKIGDKSWMAKKYGKLPDDWKSYLEKGFKECWRVLTPGGTLVFKWNEEQIRISDLMPLFPDKPIMGTRNNYKTIFIVFHKE